MIKMGYDFDGKIQIKLKNIKILLWIFIKIN